MQFASEFGCEVEEAFGFLGDLGYKLVTDRQFSGGAGIVTYNSSHVILRIIQENHHELDAELSYADDPEAHFRLRTFSGLANNEAKPPPVMFSTDRVRALRLLAELVQRYAGGAIAGDHVAFEQAARRQTGSVS